MLVLVRQCTVYGRRLNIVKTIQKKNRKILKKNSEKFEFFFSRFWRGGGAIIWGGGQLFGQFGYI